MTTWYFGYGSNLDPADWARWAARRGISPELLGRGRRAWLPDHRLCFHYHSKARSGGALDIIPSPGELVPGAVFAMSSGAWAALDRKEGAPHRYQRCTVPVLDETGQLLSATTYKVGPASIQPRLVPPQPAYLAVVRAGYAAHQIDTSAALAAAARGLDPPHQAIDFFLPAQSGQPWIAAAIETLLLPCPRVTAHAPWSPDAPDRARPGHLLQPPRDPSTLPQLDTLLGFTDWTSSSSQPVIRTLVRVRRAGGTEGLAWCYRACPPAADLQG